MAAAPGQLEIEPTASMMIHDGFAMAAGNASELRDLAQTLDEQSDIIAGIYASRTGKPQAEWRAAMRTETWYTADKALAAGLADRIRPQMTNLAHCPHCSSPATQTAFCAQCGSPLMAASNGGWKQENGNWIFDPDGDGDNDYTAAGDKDHDYWSADGKQLKSIPASPDGKQAAKPIDDDNTNPDGSKKPFPGAAPPFKPGGGNDFLISVLHDSATPHVPMIGEHDHGHPAYGSQGGDSSHGHSHKHGENGTPDAAHNHSHQAAAQASGASQFPFLDADVDNSPWDAGKAMAAGVKADDPAAFYKGICAGRRAGDPTTQAAWALPYKYTPSSPPNAAAVRNALARFSQTQGLTNAAEARKTLEAAMKVVNPDWEPSDEIDTELLAAAFSFAIEGGR